MIEADRSDPDLLNFVGRDVEHAAAHAAHPHAAHAPMPPIIPPPMPCMPPRPPMPPMPPTPPPPPRPRCASIGTPPNASGILMVRGLSVLFLIMTVPSVESFWIMTTSMSPASIPANRSTVLAGASFFEDVAGLAAHKMAGIATATARHNHC